MTTREQELIKKSFENGFFHVFDSNRVAEKVHALLEANGVKHEYGDYSHEVDGKRRYNYGIRVLDVRKLQDLILAPASDDNPVKDMERVLNEDAGGKNDAQQEPENAQADASENASKRASDEEKAQPADPAPAPKKNSRKRRKVSL